MSRVVPGKLLQLSRSFNSIMRNQYFRPGAPLGVCCLHCGQRLMGSTRNRNSICRELLHYPLKHLFAVTCGRRVIVRKFRLLKQPGGCKLEPLGTL